MSSPVITRFAPSPTGFLHIGGARTALFNWLYAKHTGGKMLLRIEDTDRERSTDAAITAIIDGLKWLGLEWDGEPIFQFARVARHREVAEQLVAAGRAYYAYDTPEELEAMRARAQADGSFARYDGRWRDRDPAQAPPGVKPAVRIKSPADGETIVDDKVLGRVAIPNKDLEDFVVLRSDGTPTYMLAVVVDDHDMGVTHIIRGVEHLTNGGRQKIIYEAMGWTVPEWAHIPLIHGPDGAKLSKRHGALGVEAYRAMGYLPEALRNYLARLGWSHGDDEIFSSEQAAEWFDLDAINKGPSRMDFEKLRSVNAHYMKATDDAQLLKRLESILPEIEGGKEFAAKLDDAARARIVQIMPAFKERAKTLVDLFQAARFLVEPRPLAMDEKAAALLDANAKALLGRLVIALSSVKWTTPTLEEAVRKFAEAEGAKLGKVAQPLRAALTGSAASPPIFEVLVALGREESLARLKDQAALGS